MSVISFPSIVMNILADAHGLVLQVRHLAPEQILGEDHTAGPELATTLSGIILEKKWGF